MPRLWRFRVFRRRILLLSWALPRTPRNLRWSLASIQSMLLTKSRRRRLGLDIVSPQRVHEALKLAGHTDRRPWTEARLPTSRATRGCGGGCRGHDLPIARRNPHRRSNRISIGGCSRTHRIKNMWLSTNRATSCSWRGCSSRPEIGRLRALSTSGSSSFGNTRTPTCRNPPSAQGARTELASRSQTSTLSRYRRTQLRRARPSVLSVIDP